MFIFASSCCCAVNSACVPPFPLPPPPLFTRPIAAVIVALALLWWQIVPLSSKVGVLEWCSNTIPLGEWLVKRPTSAHPRYRPKDKKSSAIRSELGRTFLLLLLWWKRRRVEAAQLCTRAHTLTHAHTHIHTHTRAQKCAQSFACESCVCAAGFDKLRKQNPKLYTLEDKEHKMREAFEAFKPVMR